MRSADFVTFDIFRTDGATATGALAETVVQTLSSSVRKAPGFGSARVHTGLDGTVVVARTVWNGPDAPEAGVRRLADEPGVRSATAFGGTPEPGLRGPAAGQTPQIVAVATRHFAARESAEAVLNLLAGSGEWKRHFPGFISATPYLDSAGTTFVNYPMWVDEDSYQAWMRDPRISEGQEEIALLEAAPPEYLVCRVVADVLPV
jgi:quinol monooxygenase YgiN